MFETSVVDGGRRKGVRWIGVVSLVLQAGALGGLVVVPLVYPAQMPPFRARREMISLAKPKLPRPKPQPVHATQTSGARATATATTEIHARTLPAISREPLQSRPAIPVLLPFGASMTASDGVLIGVRSAAATGSGARVGVKSGGAGDGTTRAVRLSQGVTDGMLLEPIRPAYPAMAKATRTEGIVVLTATIDRTGRIVGLRVVSGPAILRQAAESAVREARYKPYLLNGSPTEVETTISVNFRMSS